MVEQATRYHADIGQYLLLGLIGLHVAAILFYVLFRQRTLVRPMIGGDKLLPVTAPPARDDALTRAAACAVLAVCAAASWWVSALGAP